MIDLNALPLPRLFQELTADGSLDRLLDAAFAEDLKPPGDITSAGIIAPRRRAAADIVVRQPGIMAGLEAGPRIVGWRGLGGAVAFEPLTHDGDAVQASVSVARITGNLRRILAIERTLLNIIGRLSGIATLTREYVDAVAGTRAVICDTRKTTPGLRTLEKYAVRCGGGTMHRLGLFDAALYKDNHLAGIALKDLAARLTSAIESVRSLHEVRFVEVEVDSLEQLKELLRMPVGLIDIVLLDNMRPKMLQQAVRMRDEAQAGVLLEASGGVNLDSVRSIAETGVDRISVGALTHSAPCLDVGLDIQK